MGSRSGHWSKYRRILVGFVVAALLTTGLPLAAWSAPADSDPTAPVTTQDKAASPPDEKTPTEKSTDEKTTDEKTPADSDSPADSESPADRESPETAEPDKTPADDEPADEKTETAEPTPTETPKTGKISVQSVPAPSGNNSVISVKVGGDRTGTTAVNSLAGVVLGFYSNATGGSPVYQCTSDADGDCSVTVPNTQSGGANRDRQFWVRQLSAPGGTHYTNPSLGTDGGDDPIAADPYRFLTCEQLRALPSTSSTCLTSRTGNNGFMLATGSSNLEASSGIWQNSRNNPSFPAKCGINVALVLDFSNSVTDTQLTQLKNAANGFVDALTGTPSQVGTFTFATNAPALAGDTLALTSVSTAASAATVKNKITNYSRPASAVGGTNWDRGLYQVAQSASSFDVAVVITDGNPTQYSSPAEGPGSLTRFREVENGIFSANAIKAGGTKVIAFGVGSGVNNTGSGQNLRAISGPTLNTDYYQTSDYATAGQQLKALALGNCTGSITVVKQVVPANATANSTTGATPQGGWTFTGTGSTNVSFNSPNERVTAAGTGAANFPLTFSNAATTGNVTLNETQQSGYTLHTINGNNATCVRVDTGATVTSTNSGATGFTVQAASAYPVSCTVYNKAPAPLATVVLNKNWVINGAAPIPDGEQPSALVARGQLNGSTVPWGQIQSGFRQNDVVSVNETTSLASTPLCTLVSSRLTNANGTTVNTALPNNQTLREGANSYTITNTVTCDTKLRLTKTVDGGIDPPPASDWTLTATAPAGLPGPSGQTGVNGSVTAGATYTLSEDSPHPEYVQFVAPNATPRPGSSGSWNCQQVQADGETVIPGFSDGSNGGVTVPFGTYVRCNAVNQTAVLGLVKEVNNTHGGTAVPGDWQLHATPTGTFPGNLPAVDQTGAAAANAVYVNVRPGVSYDLSESGGPAGYQLTSTECAVRNPRDSVQQITLAAGEQGTCYFTNSDQPATLTLIKKVSNEHGGQATPQQWQLTATGPTSNISGPTGSDAVTNHQVLPGTYALTESGGPAGYTAGPWSCEGGTLAGADVTVPLGGAVTCTITNTDQPATLTLKKVVVNQAGGTAVATDWTLAANGPSPISGTMGDAAVTGATVKPGDYDLAESGGPAGYTASAWDCGTTGVNGSTIRITNGDNVTCTITNTDQPAQLTLVKKVTNDNGGTATATDWVLTGAGPTTITGVSGSGAVTGATVPAGAYDLSETGGPAGYTASDWDCGTAGLTGSKVTVPNGGNVTCTITNDDQPAKLTLVKVVDNGATGADAEPGDWTLAADGPTSISGDGNSAAVTGQTVDAGNYDLSEADGPGGYDAGDWVCEGASSSTATTVTVPNGGDVTCTITNTAQQPHLTLIKTVTNDNGGTAAATDWTLTADGPRAVSGATDSDDVTNAPVPIGDYDLSESGPDGYTAGDWSCTGGDADGDTVSIALGDSVTCRINNDDQPAQLTLTKVVDNGDTGADAEPGDWTLSADGPTPITGAGNSAAVTSQTVNAGSYTLAESDGPDGYDASDWVCEGDSSSTATTVTVPNGSDVTCTITNTAQPVSLTLVKVVDNGNTGATTEATAWTLTAVNGDSTVTGTTGTASVTTADAVVGTYALSEDGPDGYDASDWVCTNASGSTVDSVTLALGDAATCTITNTAQQAHLTLIKTVTNDHGGTATPSDWTLTGTGPTNGITGTTGDTTITNRPVAIGNYVLSETGGPTGYTPSNWTCDNGTLNADTITVGLGDNITCRINNNDQPAHLTLIKIVADPDNTATNHVPADWTLTADPQNIDGQNTITGNGDPNTTGGVNHVEIFAGNYQLSENGPTGFDGSLWECTGGAVTADIVTVLNGGNVTCTITNTAIAPRLTLIKHVNNDNGGTAEPTDWTLTADGPSPITGTTGNPAITNAAVQVGTYTLDETGPTGYTATTWTCVDTDNDPFPTDGASLTLAEGDNVTCTIINNDAPAHLTLIKIVDNGTTGATAEPADWTLTASSDTNLVTGPGNSPTVTNQTINAGNYELTETGGPNGYTPSTWTCEGATLNGSTVTIPNGSNVTCTITNTAEPVALTLVKVVDNGTTGATTEATAWTLTAVNGTNTITGVTNTPEVTTAEAVVGTYALSEDGPAGYAASAWVCEGASGSTADSVTLALGDAATCTITNTAQQPHLTLVKQVVNDNGGSAVDTDWTLSADGPTDGITGATGSDEVTAVPVEVGDFALSESAGPVGYTADPWQCDGGTLSGSTVTVALGDDVTCTIVNRDIPGDYVLAKSSDPETGSTVEPGDTVTYTLTVNNNSDGYVNPVVITDDLSDVLDNATIGTIGAGGELNGTTLTWTLPGPLAPGDEATLTYSVIVNDDAYGVELVNVATPDDNGTCEGPDDCTTVHPTPHWVLTKSSDPERGTTVNPGDTITYTLTARNDSDGVVRNATVSDDLSDVLDDATLVSITPADQAVVNGTTLTWTLPSPFNPGDVATLTYTVTVNDDAYNTELRNVATPGDGGECVPPAEAGGRAQGNSASARRVNAADDPEWCETNHPTPGWTLTKTSDPSSGSEVQPGDQVTYTLTATNNSKGIVTDAVVTDDMSDVLQYATLDAVPAGATMSGTTLTWNVPTLQRGESARLTYTVTVNDDAWDVEFGNVATPGKGGECVDDCSTDHRTPPEPSKPTPKPTPKPENPDTSDLADTGGPGLAPLALGAGFLLAGTLVLLEARRRRSGVRVRIGPRR